MLPPLPAPAARSAPAWPRTAIHDTVAAIAREHVYDRSVSQSLLERVFRWIGEAFARLDDALGGLPHARRVATVAAILVAVLVIARLVYAARLRETSRSGRHRARIGRRSFPDPWHDAERLAAEGRHTEAAHALYHAVIEVLAREGLVHPHRSKTSGDYTRELRAHGSPAQPAFRRFGRRYDRILFGEGRCDAPGYEALLADARPVLDAMPTERAA